MYEMSCQSRFDARYWMLGAGALGRPRGMEWGGRREEGSGWGTHAFLVFNPRQTLAPLFCAFALDFKLNTSHAFSFLQIKH